MEGQRNRPICLSSVVICLPGNVALLHNMLLFLAPLNLVIPTFDGSTTPNWLADASPPRLISLLFKSSIDAIGYPPIIFLESA